MRDPWMILVPSGLPAHRPADPDGNVLRVDADAICPRCMRFVDSTDIVRRTAYGLVQHEHCPEVSVAPVLPVTNA